MSRANRVARSASPISIPASARPIAPPHGVQPPIRSPTEFSMPPRPVSPKVPLPAPRPAWLYPLLLALTAILFLSWFTGEVADTDIWLHLMTGRHTLETRALTVPDP